MSLIDHTSLPCPAHLVEDEVRFLTGAFGCLGVRELVRPVPSVVGMGVSASGKQHEEDGSNNAFLWVFPVEEGKEVSAIHLALKAKSEYCSFISYAQ